MSDDEVRPVGRYEWEQIVRRARLGGAVGATVGKNGKRTRGAITGMTFTAVALTFASYADDKGQRVFPGDATVAVDLETTIKVVRAVRRFLVDVGLLQRVRGRRGEHGEEYRLTMPSDLLERVEVLSPAAHRAAAQRLRDAARGDNLGWSGGPPDDSASGGPVDPRSGSPVDHPNVTPAENLGWSTGPVTGEFGWSSGPRSGGPVDPLNDNDRTNISTDNQADRDLRTDLEVSRATQKPDSSPRPEPVTAAPPPSHPPGRPPGPLTPAEAEAARARGEPLPKCEHGLPDVLRDDARPRCQMCRKGVSAAAPRAAPLGIALPANTLPPNVIPLRPRSKETA